MPMLLTAVAAILAMLAPATGPASQPVGRSQVRFDTPSDLASAGESNRRFKWLGDAKPPPLRLEQETFELFVPDNYAPDGTWGVVVWASPTNSGFMCPEPWRDVLARHKLIWIGANNAGNERHSDHRVRLAVEAALQAQQRFAVDRNRVYVAGLSGGGKIAGMCATIYGDVFSGGFSICGATFYMKIPTGQERGKYYPATYPPPAGKPAIKARQQNRHVLLSGTEDFNLNSTRQTYELGYRKDNYRHVTLLIVPGLGHALPPQQWFEQGIHFLDSAADE